MIEFECPKCGEPMAVSNRKAGEKIRCVECDRPIRVPDAADEDDDDVDRRRHRRQRSANRDDGLSGTEFLLFGIAFLLVPAVNVLVSSVLYYAWRANQPRRANHINLLGFVVFGVHLAVFCVVAIISANMRGP